MKKIEDKRGLKALLVETEGLSTVEYIILLVLVAVLSITVWTTFGHTVRSTVTNSTTAVNGLSAQPP